MSIEVMKPAEIEKRSFEIITQILGDREFPPLQEPVVKRVIHTTADFEYADQLYFSDQAVQRMLEALRGGADIVTDTQMARAGINKKALARYGGAVHCFIADEDVAAEAAGRGVTRAVVSMEKACGLPGRPIFAIGNAPTALLQIKALYESGRLNPAGVIGVPVGFVNVVESKEELMRTDLPCIVARGRKGGSNVAAAICNAMLYQLDR